MPEIEDLEVVDSYRAVNECLRVQYWIKPDFRQGSVSCPSLRVEELCAYVYGSVCRAIFVCEDCRWVCLGEEVSLEHADDVQKCGVIGDREVDAVDVLWIWVPRS